MTATQNRRYHWQMLISWTLDGGEGTRSIDDTFETDQPVYRSVVRPAIFQEIVAAGDVPKNAIIRHFDVQPDLVGGVS